MVVATSRHRRLVAPPAPVSGLLPEPAGRTGAHGWAGKRVREDVRDGVAVAAFSLASSTGVSLLLFLAVRLAG